MSAKPGKKSRRKSTSVNKGIGDIVEDVLNSKPVKPITNVVKAALFKDGKDCGCEERKQRLNNLFKKSKPRCLNEAQYKQLKAILPKIKNSVDYGDMVVIANIHASVFNYKSEGPCGSCAARNRRIVHDLRVIMDEYESSMV